MGIRFEPGITSDITEMGLHTQLRSERDVTMISPGEVSNEILKFSGYY